MPIDPRRIEVIDERQAEIFRRMSPLERIETGLSMAGFAREIIAAHLRARHPSWTEDRIARETVRRFADEPRD